MDSCQVSWDVSLAPERPPISLWAVGGPWGPCKLCPWLGNSPYLTHTPIHGLTGQVYYWRLEQEACARQLGINPLLTVTLGGREPEGSGSNAESLRGWMGAGAQRGAPQSHCWQWPSTSLLLPTLTPAASSTVPQVQSWELGKSRCQGALAHPPPCLSDV